MTEYIAGHTLKAITYHHLLLLNLHMRHYLRVHYNLNHKNKFICIQTVTHYGTIRGYNKNQLI